MKKLILSGLVLTAFAFAGKAQAPSCVNDAGLEGRLSSIEAQGWREANREFVYVNYFAEPTPPYLIGTLHVTFVPDCNAGDPCPQIAMLYLEDATQQTQNTCIWSPTNIH